MKVTLATLQIRHSGISKFGPGQREGGEMGHGGKERETLVSDMEEVRQVQRGKRERGDSSHGIVIEQVSVRELQAQQRQTCGEEQQQRTTNT